MKVDEYVLTEDYVYFRDFMDEKMLPAGSFVKPIRKSYVPKHVLEHPMNVWMDEKKETFCYCSAGIIVIPFSKIRKV